jgi:hypothetical protein
VHSAAGRSDPTGGDFCRCLKLRACGRLLFPALKRGGDRRRAASSADERQEALVEQVGVCVHQAVGEAGIDFQCAVLQELRRAQGRILVGYDLVVVALHHERRHVDALEIFGEIGL